MTQQQYKGIPPCTGVVWTNTHPRDQLHVKDLSGVPILQKNRSKDCSWAVNTWLCVQKRTCMLHDRKKQWHISRHTQRIMSSGSQKMSSSSPEPRVCEANSSWHHVACISHVQGDCWSDKSCVRRTLIWCTFFQKQDQPPSQVEECEGLEHCTSCLPILETWMRTWHPQTEHKYSTAYIVIRISGWHDRAKAMEDVRFWSSTWFVLYRVFNIPFQDICWKRGAENMQKHRNTHGFGRIEKGVG